MMGTASGAAAGRSMTAGRAMVAPVVALGCTARVYALNGVAAASFLVGEA